MSQEQTLSILKYNFDDITNGLPHKFENVLLDEITVNRTGEVKTGDFQIKITDTDPYGRNLFLNKISGDQTLISTVTMEILALASLITGGLPQGYIAFFAAISNFKKNADFEAGKVISGSVKSLRGKADFMRYSGTVVSNTGSTIATGDIMAMYVKADQSIGDSEGKTIEVPQSNINVEIDKNIGFKQPEMFFIDSLIQYDEVKKECATSYRYPDNHLLTRGHFPDNSIMMGVTQWLMVNDACYALSQYLKKNNGKTGKYVMSGDAVILKKDGTICAEIKNFKVQGAIGLAGQSDYAEIIETKRIVFRSVVRPGTELIAHITKLEIDF